MITDALIKKASCIRLAVFDVDGVLTDGKLILGSNGDEYKNFHVRDGHGLVMLAKTDIEIAIVSARSSPIVSERMASLGINHIYQGQQDKQAVMLDIKKQLDLCKKEICYTGDDVIDLPAMRQVGLKIAVADAHEGVAAYADWTTASAGGNGAVREVCELIMQAQGKLNLFF